MESSDPTNVSGKAVAVGTASRVVLEPILREVLGRLNHPLDAVAIHCRKPAVPGNLCAGRVAIFAVARDGTADQVATPVGVLRTSRDNVSVSIAVLYPPKSMIGWHDISDGVPNSVES